MGKIFDISIENIDNGFLLLFFPKKGEHKSTKLFFPTLSDALVELEVLIKIEIDQGG